MAAAKKKPSVKDQQELDGFERPSIPELDEKCIKIGKLETSKKSATDKLKSENEVTMRLMQELRDAGRLEKDADGNHVYPFADGVKRRHCVLKKQDVMTFRDAGKPKVDKPDLKVVEGKEPKGSID